MSRRRLSLTPRSAGLPVSVAVTLTVLLELWLACTRAFGETWFTHPWALHQVHQRTKAITRRILHTAKRDRLAALQHAVTTTQQQLAGYFRRAA